MYMLYFLLLVVHCVIIIYRKQSKNLLLAGLWCSNMKPNMQLYLKPVVGMLKDLESKGACAHQAHSSCYNIYLYMHASVLVQPPGFEQPFTMKLLVVGCTCDLPARALVTNMMQFNGVYGCTFCE